MGPDPQLTVVQIYALPDWDSLSTPKKSLLHQHEDKHVTRLGPTAHGRCRQNQAKLAKMPRYHVVSKLLCSNTTRLQSRERGLSQYDMPAAVCRVGHGNQRTLMQASLSKDPRARVVSGRERDETKHDDG